MVEGIQIQRVLYTRTFMQDNNTFPHKIYQNIKMEKYLFQEYRRFTFVCIFVVVKSGALSSSQQEMEYNSYFGKKTIFYFLLYKLKKVLVSCKVSISNFWCIYTFLKCPEHDLTVSVKCLAVCVLAKILWQV